MFVTITKYVNTITQPTYHPNLTPLGEVTRALYYFYMKNEKVGLLKVVFTGLLSSFPLRFPLELSRNCVTDGVYYREFAGTGLAVLKVVR